MKKEIKGNNKPIYKKWWFWVLIILFVGILSPKNNTNSINTDNTSQVSYQNENVSESKQEENESSETNKEVIQVEESTPIAEEKSEKVIGKDFSEISTEKPKKVNDDVTGNWRRMDIIEQADMEEYAVDYYNRNFESDNEIHAIINFTYHTTTCISCIGSQLDVTVYDYVDGEEHSAKTLFTGTKLAEYLVNKSNGSIEKLE